jgi:hypothetical protein
MRLSNPLRMQTGSAQVASLEKCAEHRGPSFLEVGVALQSLTRFFAAVMARWSKEAIRRASYRAPPRMP